MVTLKESFEFGARTLIAGTVLSGLIAAAFEIGEQSVEGGIADFRAQALECAPHLGKVAVKVDELPVECQPLREMFDMKSTTVTIRTLSTTRSSTTTAYTLMPEVKFQGQVTEAIESSMSGISETNEYKPRLLRFFFGIGALGGAVDAVFSAHRRRHKKNNRL